MDTLTARHAVIYDTDPPLRWSWRRLFRGRWPLYRDGVLLTMNLSSPKYDAAGRYRLEDERVRQALSILAPYVLDRVILPYTFPPGWMVITQDRNGTISISHRDRLNGEEK